MTERRKYIGKERRGRAGKRFTTAEEILSKKKLAAEKLAMYESDENVKIKMFTVYAIAIGGLVSGYVGLNSDKSLLLWIGVTATVVALTLGEKWIRSAKKCAREKFEKDPNRHLAQYLQS